MKKLSVLLVTAEYSFSISGGAGVYARQHAESLAREGVNVYVITSGESNQVTRISPNLTIEKVKTVYLPVIRTPLFLRSIRQRLPSLLKEQDVQIIHSNNTAAAWISTELPLITTLHHPVSFENKNFFFMQRLLNTLDIFNEKLLITKSKKIVATSNESYDIFLNLYPKYRDKFCLVRIGVDLDFFKPIIGAKETLLKRYKLHKTNKIVFVPGAARAKRKGFEVFIKAVGEISNTNVRYLVSGTAREIGWESYKTKILSSSKVLDKVILTGELDYSELPLYYSGSDFAVFPSLFEGYGLPTLEALSCGVPVISTDTGEAKSILNSQNGILVEPNDQVALKNAIVKLFEDSSLLRKFSRNARSSVQQRYNWKLICIDYIRHYEKL